MKKNAKINATPVCQVRMQAISDAMSLLSGKWKFHILGTLIAGNTLGFMDLLREINGIGTKMLSKELQDLEMNNLISRKVMDTKPITVEYSTSTEEVSTSTESSTSSELVEQTSTTTTNTYSGPEV